MKIQNLIYLVVLFYVINTVGAFNDFSLSFENAKAQVCSCATYTIPVLIENTGDQASNYYVYLSGEQYRYAQLSEDSFYLKPKEAKKIILILNVPCDYRGFYNLKVNVVSNKITKSNDFNVYVNKCNNIFFVVDKNNQTCSCGKKEFKFFIKNIGVGEETFVVSLDKYNEYANFEKNSFTLQEGKESYSKFILELPCVKYKDYNFNVEAYAMNNNLKSVVPISLYYDACGYSQNETGIIEEEKSISFWLLVLLVILIALCFGIFVAYSLLKGYQRKKTERFIDEELKKEKYYLGPLETYEIGKEEEYLVDEKKIEKGAKVSRKFKLTLNWKFVLWLIALIIGLGIISLLIIFVIKSKNILIGYIGYAGIGFVVLGLIIYTLIRFKKTEIKKEDKKYVLEEVKKGAEKKIKKTKLKVKTKTVGWILILIVVILGLLAGWYFKYLAYAIVGVVILAVIILIHIITRLEKAEEPKYYYDSEENNDDQYLVEIYKRKKSKKPKKK